MMHRIPKAGVGELLADVVARAGVVARAQVELALVAWALMARAPAVWAPVARALVAAESAAVAVAPEKDAVAKLAVLPQASQQA